MAHPRWAIFSSTEEFLFSFMSDDETTMARIPQNIQAYVEWFNRLSYLFVTEIVRQEKRDKRLRVLQFVIDGEFF